MNTLEKLKQATDAILNLKIVDFKDDKIIDEIARLRMILIDVSKIIRSEKKSLYLPKPTEQLILYIRTTFSIYGN